MKYFSANFPLKNAVIAPTWCRGRSFKEINGKEHWTGWSEPLIKIFMHHLFIQYWMYGKQTALLWIVLFYFQLALAPVQVEGLLGYSFFWLQDAPQLTRLQTEAIKFVSYRWNRTTLGHQYQKLLYTTCFGLSMGTDWSSSDSYFISGTSQICCRYWGRC